MVGNYFSISEASLLIFIHFYLVSRSLAELKLMETRLTIPPKTTMTENHKFISPFKIDISTVQINLAKLQNISEN